MVKERAQRRLAAILVADVVGYSRLTQANEAGTLAALKARHSDILKPIITRHSGRIIRMMGDGMLVEFASGVNAVDCAGQIQAAMRVANVSVPEGERILLRIGINLGDVMVEGSDLHGDAVNIAARLEALAEPGGVIVSRTVFKHVHGKVSHAFQDLGEQRLKSISEPVRIYRLSGAIPELMPSPDVGREPAKPSIAVLPFANMSGDATQEYLSDGITEDIITDLSKVSALRVISRNTVFAIKSKTVEVGKIARQLNVSHVLEGSVRKSGQRIRITAQLIDGSDDSHVWAERYDRNLGDIFALQDEISQAIVAALKLKLLPGEKTAITARATTSTAAYECYLQGRSLSLRWGNRAALKSARKMFERASEIDPGYARAYAGIADCDAGLWMAGDLDVSIQEMLTISVKALDLAPDLAEVHASRGLALYLSGQAKQAVAAFQRAIALDPALPMANQLYGFCCRDTGQFERAAVLFMHAAELDPRDSVSLSMASEAYLALGQSELCTAVARQAMSRIEAAIAQRPDFAGAVGWGATTLVYLGENAKAEEWARHAVSLSPKDYSIRYNVACAYAFMGAADAALENLEYIYSEAPRARHWVLGMLKYDNQFNPLRERPDFKAFMARLEAAVTAQI
jgi:adenylate cyclase